MKRELTPRRIFAAAIAISALFLGSPPAQASDPDEAELLNHFEKVDVWHYPVDYAVRHNNQDVIVTREMVAQPAPLGELCYIRFDLIKGEGDYGYGFKPGGPRDAHWGVNVLKRGTVLNQLASRLKMNVIYFYAQGPKSADASAVCARKQGAPTAEAGNAYRGPWADLVTKSRLIHGWPTAPAP
ncbi:hypothetical protein [Methylocystis sp.]|uniref:hypothetical protein n=1 Tax=Methylocystis sp. TaxID=1911079 RepID=UPI003D0FCF41